MDLDTFFHYLFPNSNLISATDGAARIFLPPYAMAGFEPLSIELHQTRLRPLKDTLPTELQRSGN